MTLRRWNILLWSIAIGLGALSFYLKPDQTVPDCIKWGPADLTISACTALIESPELDETDMPILLAKRAWAARRLGDFETAMRDIDHALALQPDVPFLWVNHAFINDAQGAWAVADEDFERALALAPENLSTIMDRAVILTGRDDYSQALRAYQQALEIAPNRKRAMQGVIRSYLYLEQYDNALEQLTQAVQRWPEDEVFLSKRGELHLLYFKDFNSALADYVALERLNPAHSTNRLMLGITHLKLGQIGIGKSYIEQFVVAQVATPLKGVNMFERAVYLVGIASNLVGDPHLLLQGIAYASAEQPALARAAFAGYLESGGGKAEGIMRKIFIANDICATPNCEWREGAGFEDALTRYIDDLARRFRL
jgi:tetratricopeptide (TPR) repeat protein